MFDNFQDFVRAKKQKVHLCANGCGAEIAVRRKYCIDCGDEIAMARKRTSNKQQRANGKQDAAT